MPAESKSQRRLMAAAEHGAQFPLARRLRREMTKSQLHDFAATKEKDLPDRKGSDRKGSERKGPHHEFELHTNRRVG